MRLLVAPEARLEFEAARRYYAQQSPGLGEAFHAQVRGALQRIRNWPLAGPVERGGIRRATLGRFPYKVLYAIEADHIYLIAIAHQHRHPEYWVRRPHYRVQEVD